MEYVITLETEIDTLRRITLILAAAIVNEDESVKEMDMDELLEGARAIATV